MSEWQLCPLCKGQGQWVADDCAFKWTVCHICNGKGLILKPADDCQREEKRGSDGKRNWSEGMELWWVLIFGVGAVVGLAISYWLGMI